MGSSGKAGVGLMMGYQGASSDTFCLFPEVERRLVCWDKSGAEGRVAEEEDLGRSLRRRGNR